MVMVKNQNADEVIGAGLNVQLDLTVTDPETAAELLKHREAAARDDFALSALKIGVLAVRQANGVVDAHSIQQECRQFLEVVAQTLSSHSEGVSAAIGALLGKYFDPSNGEFPQRIDRLVRRDGELEMLLGRHINGDGSALATTLEKHIGANSPLLQMLSPDQRKGILAALGLALDDHGKAIVGQFSLGDKDSALSRLLVEITEKNGALREDLTRDLEHVRNEFCLDNEDGALARLVGRVDRAHKTILSEFSVDNEHSALNKMSNRLESTNRLIDSSLSLDEERSPLSRLRREILLVIDGMNKANNDFQAHVRTTLESLKTRRAEAARSTTHGLDFQDQVGEFVQHEAQRCGDLFESTKYTAGALTRSKVGDFVVVLGPDSQSPDARIVVEAKEDKSYDLKSALEELKKARENRKAEAGLFVISRKSAPAGIESLMRWDRDIVAVWDAEDPNTDVIFRAAVSVARMIAIREKNQSEQASADIAEMKSIIDSICRDVSLLDKILKAAGNARTHCDTIIKQATDFKTRVESSLARMQEHVQGLAAVIKS
jgi:hypothetical protein